MYNRFFVTVNGKSVACLIGDAEGRALNRRVEIYITANQEMIRQAEAGTLK